MATKPAKASDTDVEELLDTLDQTLDRLKTLYEQYFLGIQKQAPSFIHSDVERKIRDLTQMNLRNTGVRYRLATLTQKFGSYNSYWRRTLRQIENGTYARQLQKIGRDAVRSGADVPEEILAAMPKRMRDQVVRDREAAIAVARRRQAADGETRLAATDQAVASSESDEVDEVLQKEQLELRRKHKTTDGSHLLDAAEGDFDIDAFFAEVEHPGEVPPPAAKPPTSAPRRRATSATPFDRPRSTTRTDLIRQGTTPPPVPRAVTSTPTPEGPPQEPMVGGAGGARPAAPARVMPPPVPRSSASSSMAASQRSRPISIVPGAAAARGPVPVESMQGPFSREKLAPPLPIIPPIIPPIPKPGTIPSERAVSAVTPLGSIPSVPGVVAARTAAAARAPAAAPQRPPPGMTDADVNALYAKYVKAKEMVGEAIGPGEHTKLLKTLNAQAPRIMEQYKASGVDFSVVVKDNQVIIRAKPKH